MAQGQEPGMITKTLQNSVEPFNPQTGGAQVFGSIQSVAAEVAVSKFLRWLLKMEQRSVYDLAILHSVSQGMLGGFMGYFNDMADIDTKDLGVGGALADGAKGLPALVVAQYIVNTAAKGLHFPGFSMKDLLITGASKALTRPLLNKTAQWHPKAVRDNFKAHDRMVQRQKASARMASAPGN